MVVQKFRIQHFILLALFWIAFALSMRLNFFHIASSNHFDRFADQTESFVLGRASMSQQNGFWSQGGLLGRDTAIANDSVNEFQLQSYLKNAELKSFKVYPSTPGGSGWLFSTFTRVSSLTPAQTLSAFRWVISAFSATIFTFIIHLFGLKFGRIAFISTGLGLLFSPMITVAGGHIYWMFGVFMLPMLPLLSLVNSGLDKINQALVASSLAFFLKCILTGFELITASSIAPAIVLAFALGVNGCKKELVLKKLFQLFVGMGSALVLSLAILTVQISSVRGSYKDGLAHFIDRFETRTVGSKIPASAYSTYSEMDAKSSVLDVVKYYGSNFYALTLYTSKESQMFGIKYQSVFILFLIVTAINFFIAESKLKILTIFGWLSFLAPISWLAVFKAHALLHPQLDVLTWFLPTLLFVYVTFGATLASLIARLFRNNVSAP
jgi:hypothetical protein